MKLRYPLRAEDVMKLLDKALDAAIELSRPVQTLTRSIEACATSIENLASVLDKVAHNQLVHQHMIAQLWNTQQLILRKLQMSSLNMEMPAIRPEGEDKKPKPGTDKPN